MTGGSGCVSAHGSRADRTLTHVDAPAARRAANCRTGHHQILHPVKCSTETRLSISPGWRSPVSDIAMYIRRQAGRVHVVPRQPKHSKRSRRSCRRRRRFVTTSEVQFAAL